MSFARPRHTPDMSVATSLQRHIDRQIEEKIAEQKNLELEIIKKAAAPKIRVDKRDWAVSRDVVDKHRAEHAIKLQQEAASLLSANHAFEANLQSAQPRTDLNLRRSVAERGQALLEAGAGRRQAEATQHNKNKRKLATLVQKAKPRTEVALPSEVLDGREALENEKRSAHRAEHKALVKANKALSGRLQDVARGRTDAALASHAAAHDQRRQQMDKAAAAKRHAEQRADKRHAKQLAQLASTAKPKTLVSLSAEHEQKLSELTQASERKAKQQRDELKQHANQLTKLTAGSQRKVDLPPLDSATGHATRSLGAGTTEQRAATVIQAARRGSVGRGVADVARGALARRQALTLCPDAADTIFCALEGFGTQNGGSGSKLAAKLQATVANAQATETLEAEARGDGIGGGVKRRSIGERTLTAAQSWLAAQNRLKNRLTQRRDAVTPAGLQAFDAAATAAAAAA